MTAAPSLAGASRPLPGAAGASANALGWLASGRLPWPVLLYLMAVVVPVSFPVGPLHMTTLRLLLLLLTVPLAVQLLMGRFGRVFLVDVLFFLHVAWAMVALAVNNPDQVVQQAGSIGVEFIGGYLVGRAYIRTPDAFAALCRTVVLVVCCTLPFALHETLTGRSLILELLNALPFLDGVNVIDYPTRMGLERAQVTFAHPIHYGLFCSLAFPLAFVALRGVTGPTRRTLTSAAVALCSFLSLSSGALLAVALQVGLIAWAALFARTRLRWWLLVALLVLAYGAVAMLSNRPPIRVFMSYATFSSHNAYIRAIIFEYGMLNLWSSPVFGIGLKDWLRPAFLASASIDNFWLVMAMRYGLPGFLLLALGFAFTLVRMMRLDLRRSLALTRFRRAWVFTFLGLSFTLCTVHVWTNLYSFVFFLFGAGLWLLTAAPGTAADVDAAGPSPDPARGAQAVARRAVAQAPPFEADQARGRAPARVDDRAAARASAAAPEDRGPLRSAAPPPPGDPARPAVPYSRFPAVRRRGPSPPDGS